MSGSVESVRWNAYVHRLDLGYSLIRKSRGSGKPANSKGKTPSRSRNQHNERGQVTAAGHKQVGLAPVTYRCSPPLHYSAVSKENGVRRKG